MTESKVDKKFTADINGGLRPMYSADVSTMKIIERSQRNKSLRWQGFSSQPLTSDEDPTITNVTLSIFVDNDVPPGTYELKDNSKIVAVYSIVHFDVLPDAYISLSGQITLDVVPSLGDLRLQGKVSFIGEYGNNEDERVHVTNGIFNFT